MSIKFSQTKLMETAGLETENMKSAEIPVFSIVFQHLL